MRRNAPSLYNVAYRSELFLDGRSDSLEAQIWEPLLAENEMANLDRAQVIARLRGIAAYREGFRSAFGDQGINEATLAMALASYQRALLSADSPFDQWYYGGQGIDPMVEQGFSVFQQAGCSSCHTLGEDHALFSNGQYYNTGIAHASRMRPPAQQVQIAPGVFVQLASPVAVTRLSDEGRAEVTGDAAQRWHYVVPSLRNVALTAPYMHDGSLPTLETVIDYYRRGGSSDPGKDPRVRRLALSDDEAAALAAFLRALTGSNVLALARDARSAPVGDQQ